MIPKNTSVLVARVPFSGDKKKNNGPGTGLAGVGGFQHRHRRLLPQSAPLQPSSVAKAITKLTSQIYSHRIRLYFIKFNDFQPFHFLLG